MNMQTFNQICRNIETVVKNSNPEFRMSGVIASGMEVFQNTQGLIFGRVNNTHFRAFTDKAEQINMRDEKQIEIYNYQKFHNSECFTDCFEDSIHI